MKIIHVISYFQPLIGYQEYYLSKEQIKAGHEVYVITSDRYFPFKYYKDSYKQLLGKRKIGQGIFEFEGIKIIRLGTYFEFKSFLLLKGITRLLDQIQPDIIIVHGLEQPLGMQMIFFLSSRNFIGKVIFDSHWGSYYRKNEWKRIIYGQLWTSLTFNKYQKLRSKTIAVTDNCKDALVKYLNLKESSIDVVSLGVNVDVFNYSEIKRNEIRNKLNISKDSIVGIYSGKISKDKGISNLVEALKILIESYSEFYFIFIGFPTDQELINLIERINKRKVFLIPPVTPEELAWHYSAADFGVWPASITISHYEAMAVGLPIIVSSLKASSERVRFNNGIQLHSSSTSAIITAINELIKDPSTRIEMGQNGKEAVNTYLTWKIINYNFIN